MTPIELLQKIYTETSLENFWSAEDLQEGNESIHKEIGEFMEKENQLPERTHRCC